MDNDEVIGTLEKMLEELTTRRDELEGMVKDLDGSSDEVLTLERRLDERIVSLNQRIRHIQQRLRERKLARDLGNEVKPLSTDRKMAMEAALDKVSQDIAATNTVKAAIELAKEISDAASNADDAAAVA